MIYHPSLLAIEGWLWDLLVVSSIELCKTQTVPSPIHVGTREVANWDSLVVQAQSFAQHRLSCPPSLWGLERWVKLGLTSCSSTELCTTQTVPSPIHVGTREVANWDSLVVQAQSFAQHRLSCPPSLWGLERWVKLGLTSCSSTELCTTQTVLSPFPAGTREVAWDSQVVQAQSFAQHRLSCPPSLWGLERWLGTHSLFKHRAWQNTDCPVPPPPSLWALERQGGTGWPGTHSVDKLINGGREKDRRV